MYTRRRGFQSSGAMPWRITSQTQSNETEQVDLKNIVVVNQGTSQPSQTSQPNQVAAQNK